MTDGLPLAYKGYPGYELKVCTTHEDRVACQDLCFHLYREPSYGVEDPHHVARWLGPLHRFIYVGAWRRRSGCLAGTFRLQKDYNPLGFSNIHDELAEFCRNGHGLVDIGASTFPQGGQQASVFEGLFTLTLKYLLASEIYGVYIQVQPQQVPMYAALGFLPVTDPFQPPGWRSTWRGMLLRLDRIPRQWDQPGFLKTWRQATGVNLRRSFWHRVTRRVNSTMGWD